MKRKLAGLTLLTMVAASVGLSPATAAANDALWPLTCADDSPIAPMPSTVTIDSEGLHVNLAAVDGDAQAISDYAADLAVHWAFCIAFGGPTGSAWCLAAVVQSSGSYVNVEPPQIDVNYPAMIQAAAACALSG